MAGKVNTVFEFSTFRKTTEEPFVTHERSSAKIPVHILSLTCVVDRKACAPPCPSLCRRRRRRRPNNRGSYASPRTDRPVPSSWPPISWPRSPRRAFMIDAVSIRFRAKGFQLGFWRGAVQVQQKRHDLLRRK